MPQCLCSLFYSKISHNFSIFETRVLKLTGNMSSAIFADVLRAYRYLGLVVGLEWDVSVHKYII